MPSGQLILLEPEGVTVAVMQSEDSPSTRGRRRPLLCPVLIGRESELDLLVTSLDAASRSRGSTVFLVGEAGNGKSRLVRELIDRTPTGGVTVLSGRAVAGSVQVPYRPLTEAVLRFSSNALLDAVELRPFRPALGHLLPDCVAAGHEPGSDSPLEPNWVRGRTHRGWSRHPAAPTERTPPS